MFINYNKVSAFAFLRRWIVPMLVFSRAVKLLVVGQKSIKAFSMAEHLAVARELASYVVAENAESHRHHSWRCCWFTGLLETMVGGIEWRWVLVESVCDSLHKGPRFFACVWNERSTPPTNRAHQGRRFYAVLLESELTRRGGAAISGSQKVCAKNSTINLLDLREPCSGKLLEWSQCTEKQWQIKRTHLGMLVESAATQYLFYTR